MASRTRIALFAATGWEVRAVRAGLPIGRSRALCHFPVLISTAGAREYWLIRTGMGPVKAARAAALLLQHLPFDLAISTGFACALIPAQVGDILAGEQVLAQGDEPVAQNESYEATGAERDRCVEVLRRSVSGVRFGRFLSVDRVVWRATDKQAYARTTGAVALDMESGAIARECRRAGVSFLALRAVSDLLDEDLPMDFNLYLGSGGWAKGVAAMLTAPSCVRGVFRLRRQSRLAAERLTGCVRTYVEAVDAVMGGQREPGAAAEHV